MWMKTTYTCFVAVLVPFYWQAYGPQNFLAFCDVALLLTLVGLWTESRRLISVQAVGIMFPQFLWITDFCCGLAGLGSPTGLSGYMFDTSIPLFIRGLSLFHLWMPFMLLWLVRRMDYDHSAFKNQSLLTIGVLLATFMLVGGPHTKAGNVNRAFGWGDTSQTVMHPLLWLAIVALVHTVVIYLPSHLVLKRLSTRTATASEPELVVEGA